MTQASAIGAQASATGADAAHPGRLSQLDGLRGFAALVIMLYHSALVFRTHGPFVRGYLLVDLFFLLSGFVLAVSTEKKLNAGVGALAFAWARFLRLWPLVAVGAGVAAVWAVVGGGRPVLDTAWVLLLDLAMIPVLSGAGPFYRLNGPQWTLFWELVANFVHALLLRRVPTRWLLLLAALMGAALIHTVRRHGGDTMGVSALTWKTWWMPIPRVGFSYVLGVWLGRLYKGGARTPALPWFVALALPVAGVMAVPYLPLRNAHGDLVFVMAFLPLAMWLVAMARIPAWLAPRLDWLGAFSLPLYCVHLTVLVAVSTLGHGLPFLTLAIAASCAVAWVFHRLVSFKGKPLAVKGAAAAA
ncbi:acyltransferase family protein [Novosphingobium bradum]|uniref:Acyltransferase family protein n=1 Tax=Novosphingobium bradum TaxID=1737444 RepID=A0ABV7IVX2_9SPHN